MKKLFCVWLFIVSYLFVSAQKPTIDSSVYGKWPGGAGAALSDDGKYFYYTVDNASDGSQLILQATIGNWKRTFSHADPCDFGLKGRLVLFKQGDTLVFYAPGTDTRKYIPDVFSFWVLGSGKQDWLVFQCKSERQKWNLQNLTTSRELSFDDVSDFSFDDAAYSAFILKRVSADKSELQRINLSDGAVTTIWQGEKADDFKFSPDGNWLAFPAETGEKGSVKKQLWFYRAGAANAGLVIQNDSQDEFDGTNNLQCVTNTGDIFFYKEMRAEKPPTINPKLAAVDVYSYRDGKLQSQQLKENKRPKTRCVFVYDTGSKKITRLENDRERVVSDLTADKVLVVRDSTGDGYDEWNWNPKAVSSVYLVSAQDGSRKCLLKDAPFINAVSYKLSPTGKYVIYYDAFKKAYFSYDTKTAARKNITIGIKGNWIEPDACDKPDSIYEDINTTQKVGWLKDDAGVLLYSQTDLFLADPAGVKPAINLTGGEGHARHIRFELAAIRQNDIDPKASLLLRATNLDTKATAICEIIPGKINHPKIPKWLPYSISDGNIAKASGSDWYIVNMESAEKPENAYLTTDFKLFRQITNVEPQKTYNWLTDELITWKTPDGKTTQGILYKSENFDPKKKYPVIFDYYERRSGELHKFLYPRYTGDAEVDIPTYVSNGYLVLVPDIHYEVGYPGRSALNAVVSAADYLKRFSWVDQKHMGLAGHSFGGFETDYIIAHSHRFAAASAGAGMTDYISAYGSIMGNGTSREHQYELYRDRIGATLWQRPDLYMENSPVLRADKISTPVLMLADLDDADVPHEQGFELFTALRRLQKPAWLLQYDGEGHGVDKPVDAKDYSIRVRQFFDYYLKGLPPPKWMTEGIPATRKQIDTGYELDTSGTKP